MRLHVPLKIPFGAVRTLMLLIPLILLTPLNLLPFEGGDVIHGEGVTVRFDPPLLNAAGEILNIYPEVKRELEESLRLKVNFSPSIVLIKENTVFQQYVMNEMVVAVAIPRRYLIVIDYSRMNKNPFTFRATIKHELCHLLLHHYIREENLPKWLDEGVSQWASSGISELITDPWGSTLKEASLSKRFIPLSHLDEAFPSGGKSLTLAYEQSKSIIEYIVSGFGTEGLAGLLGYLRDGYSIYTAVQRELSTPFYEIERSWQESVTPESALITYLSYYVYEILFFAAAVITVIGFIKLLMKKRAYRDEKEEHHLPGNE